MASELVNTATSDKLAEVDWTKNIKICELVANDPRQAKDVIKAIKKRLGSKNSNSQLYAVMLLEVLMNNIGEAVHKQVVELGILPILVKIVKKKSDLPVRGRIFLLLDAAQMSVGGAAGKFPQYYKAYYDLVSAGVKFPQRSHPVSSNTNPSSSSANHNSMTIASIVAAGRRAHKPEESQPAPGLSIIEKATAALEVLREVLNAVIAQNPEAAKDEFTLDLVEQCSFQKDRVMHLVMSSRDEKLVSQAIELNEQLGSVLAKHAALVSHVPASTSTFLEHDEELTLDENYHRSATWVSNNSNHVGRRDSNHSNHVRNWGTWASNHNYNAGQPALTPNHFSPMGHEEIEEEEETSQLFRRIRKGKTLVRPEDEENAEVRPFGVVGASVSNERLLCPLIRPSESPPHEIKVPPSAALVPPPPSKHVERERFFQEKKGDGTLSGHMRGLSLHSRNGSMSSFNASSSSYNGSMSSRE